MALIKSYLICWVAIITISMGADNWIELTRPRRKQGRNDIAIVQGNVRFWGPELRRSSTSGSAIEEEGLKIHEVYEAKSLILVPECTLSAEYNVFTFKGRFLKDASWLYSDTSPTTTTTTQESFSRTAANRKIQMLSQDALLEDLHYYLVWTVDCEAGLNGIIPKQFREFSSKICKITITAPKYTVTKKEILYYEATEEDRFPGRKPRAVCELPKPLLPLPPKPADIVAALSESHGAHGADWMNTYWHQFSTFLEQNDVPEMSHFLHAMIHLTREWNNEAITPTDAKDKMTQIFNHYIDIRRADCTPINIPDPFRKTLMEWAEKTHPWSNEDGELQVVPTGTEWTRVVTAQCTLSNRGHLRSDWYASELYKNWLDTEDGEKYRKEKFKQDTESKLIKKEKKRTAATASGVSHSEPYKSLSDMMSQFKALESYYNNIYNDMGYYGYDGYDGFDEYDEYDEGYDENDVTAAYWRGYVNGLLSRLNK